MGGLGNLIFQFLFAFSISKKYGAELYICYEYQDKRENILNYKSIFENFAKFVNVSELRLLDQPFYEYKEPVWKYHDVHELPKDGTVIVNGYFQSWKYSDTCIEEYKDFFHTLDVNHVLENCVCVHVRRGDYLQYSEIHPVMNEEYYTKAMETFGSDKKYLVFAEFQDDQEFRNWNVWKEYDVEFIKGLDPLQTLFMMSRCEHFIIPNSTLSLCAYNLRKNRDAQLVAPGNWFGPKGPEFDIQDIIKHRNLHTLILYPTNSVSGLQT